MNILFKLKKQTREESVISPSQASSQQHLLPLALRRSISAPYSFASSDQAPQSVLSNRPSTSHSGADSTQSVSLQNPFEDPEYEDLEESLPAAVSSSVRATSTKDTPMKTLFVFLQGFGKKAVFTTAPYTSPMTEMDNSVAYIEAPGYHSWGPSSWSASAYGVQSNDKTNEAGIIPPLSAKMTRTPFWKKLFIDLVDSPESPAPGNGRIEMNIIFGIVLRGYTFTLPGAIDEHRKEYRWIGTTMYSKTVGFADLKLVDPDTKRIIATFEKKWPFSSVTASEAQRDKGKANHGDPKRDAPFGCLHIFERNVPTDMNEWFIILTAYCVIEAHTKKREGVFK